MLAGTTAAGVPPLLSQTDPECPLGTAVKSRLCAYGIAAVALGVALALRWALTPWLGTRVPFITLFPAVAVVVWFAGRLPSAVTAVVGYVLIDVMIVEPTAPISAGASRAVAFIAYLASCGIIIAFGDGMRRSRSRLKASQPELQRQVEALTKLHELSLRLAVVEDLSSALSVILKTLVDIHRASHGVILLAEDESGELNLAASIGFDERAREILGRLKASPNAGSSARAFANGRRVVLFDIESDAGSAEYHVVARSIGLRAAHSTPILTRSGEVLGVISVYFAAPRQPDALEIQCSDMSARHAAEAIESRRNRQSLQQSEQLLRRQAAELEQQLIASGRLVSIGEITASLAHEFNNPLGIMIGFAEDLKNQKPPTDPDYRPLSIIYEEGRRCQKIVAELLEFARPQTADLKQVLPRELIEKALSFVSPRLHRQGIRVEVLIDDGVDKLSADPVQMGQVLVNLYLNALDAMPHGGSLTTRVGRAPAADGRQAIQISVTDTGCGIAQASLGRIFHPFFTEKKRTGLGLGLPLCQRIVENHGGSIEVASELNKGTAFTIRLPVSR